MIIDVGFGFSNFFFFLIVVDLLVGVWLPGKKVKKHVHILKSNFVMFGYRAFDHAEAIFTKAAIPNF